MLSNLESNENSNNKLNVLVICFLYKLGSGQIVEWLAMRAVLIDSHIFTALPVINQLSGCKEPNIDIANQEQKIHYNSIKKELFAIMKLHNFFLLGIWHGLLGRHQHFVL